MFSHIFTCFCMFLLVLTFWDEGMPMTPFKLQKNTKDKKWKSLNHCLVNNSNNNSIWSVIVCIIVLHHFFTIFSPSFTNRASPCLHLVVQPCFVSCFSQTTHCHFNCHCECHLSHSVICPNFNFTHFLFLMCACDSLLLPSFHPHSCSTIP